MISVQEVVTYNQINQQSIEGSGCGSVGREFASNSI